MATANTLAFSENSLFIKYMRSMIMIINVSLRPQTIGKPCECMMLWAQRGEARADEWKTSETIATLYHSSTPDHSAMIFIIFRTYKAPMAFNIPFV